MLGLISSIFFHLSLKWAEVTYVEQTIDESSPHRSEHTLIKRVAEAMMIVEYHP